ncbi:MAG: beta-ketoacyl-ACP synthase III [Oligoflexia bacterium]|jgi:3-oxoacyl-[acyl-carrier-protein] synthase-3
MSQLSQSLPPSPFASRILGTGSAFPSRRLTNDELAPKIDSSDEWIRERTGIVERRISEPGNSSEYNSSLGHEAALKALEMAGKKPEDIDQILYATCSGDTIIPSTACWLQSKLGAKNAWAVDLNAACSGFIYALSTADMFIRSGQSKTVLVVGAEVLSANVNWDDRTSCILFGDGAGAAVLERTTPDSSSRILSSHLQSDGNLWDLLIIPGGGTRLPVTHEGLDSRQNKIQMKGKEVFKIAVKTLADFALQAIEANGLKPSEIDWFLPHQANLRIIEAVANRLDFPMEKVLVNLDRYGNTSSATVPTMLDEAVRDGRIKKGQLVLMDVFGAGLTYGSVLVRM